MSNLLFQVTGCECLGITTAMQVTGLESVESDRIRPYVHPQMVDIGRCWDSMIFHVFFPCHPQMSSGFHDIPWNFHEISMKFPWNFHEISMKFPWNFHDIPWIFHEMSMIISMIFHEISMKFPCGKPRSPGYPITVLSRDPLKGIFHARDHDSHRLGGSGSMYAIYDNNYHQYTPFMLAYIYIYHTWILWVIIYNISLYIYIYYNVY